MTHFVRTNCRKRDHGLVATDASGPVVMIAVSGLQFDTVGGWLAEVVQETGCGRKGVKEQVIFSEYQR